MRKIEIEFHVKGYGRVKGTNKVIGLQTRLLIHLPRGNTEIENFDYQHQAIKYINKNFGDLFPKDENGNSLPQKYEYVNLWKRYGKAGYKW